MTKPTTNPRTMDTTADDSIVPRPNKEIDDALGTPQSVIADRPHDLKALPKEYEDDRGPKQFPEIIGDGIASCMRDRTAHLSVEKELDEWMTRLPANKYERVEKLRVAREQIETAKQAIEAFYIRFRNLASTAKN